MNYQHTPSAPETFIPDVLDSITEASTYSSGITPTIEYRSGYSDLTHQSEPVLMQGKLYTGTGHCCFHGCTEPSHLYFAGNAQDGKFYGVKESCATHTWAGVPPRTPGVPDESVLGWYALDGDGCTTNAPVVDESHTMEWQQDVCGAFHMDPVPEVGLLASLDVPMDTMSLLEPLDAFMQANMENTENTVQVHSWQDRPEEATLEKAQSTAAATYVPLQPVRPTSISAYRQAHIAYLANKIVELNSWTPSVRGLKRASTCPTIDDAVSTSVSLRQSQTWPSGSVSPVVMRPAVAVQPAPPQTSVAGSMDLDLTQNQALYQSDFAPAESQL